jgi:hypothetical protein
MNCFSKLLFTHLLRNCQKCVSAAIRNTATLRIRVDEDFTRGNSLGTELKYFDHELRSCGDIELSEKVGEMVPNRADRDSKSGRDLFVRVSTRNQCQHLDLSARQGNCWANSTPPRSRAQQEWFQSNRVDGSLPTLISWQWESQEHLHRLARTGSADSHAGQY